METGPLAQHFHANQTASFPRLPPARVWPVSLKTFLNQVPVQMSLKCYYSNLLLNKLIKLGGSGSMEG